MAGQLGAASTVAARRCIQNDEIISNILLFKPLKTTESAENKALVNIALVCKALEEPAMNELWRDLYSFAPLLLLLPCIQLIRRTYVLTGPLGRNDWIRFDHYARRVRTLFLRRSPISTFLLPTVDPSVYLRIAQEHAGPVLPHLRSLFCIPLTTEAAIFLNPGFLRLIGFESDNNAMTLTFLSSVASQAPKAEDLRITLTGVFDPYIYSHIGKFHAIRKLHLTLGSGPLAEYVKLDRVLAKLGLRRFDITAPDQWERDVPNHRFEPGFAELETLGIAGGFQWINATLVRVHSTGLSELGITLTQNLLPPALNWGSLISTIFNRWWSSLHTICLDIQHSSPSADFNSLFGSIDRLRNLRTFGLRRYWPMNISDKDIEKFAQNCPAMEWIALVSGREEERVAPSIFCLPYLAKHCPKLEVIEMSLKAGVNLPLEISPALHDNYVRCFFASMDLSPDPPKIRAIAKYLDITFPRLEHVNVNAWSAHGSAASWRELESLVKKFQMARVKN